jgi:hypothetical protein
MESDWVKVYESDKFYEAERIQGILEDSLIKAFIMNKQDSIYMFGEIEVYVSTEDAFLARQLIMENEGE